MEITVGTVGMAASRGSRMSGSRPGKDFEAPTQGAPQSAAELTRIQALLDQAAHFGRRLARRYAAELRDRNLRKLVLMTIRRGWPDLRGRPRDPLVTEAERLRAQGWLWSGIAERLLAGLPERDRRRRLRRLRAAVGARRAAAGRKQRDRTRQKTFPDAPALQSSSSSSSSPSSTASSSSLSSSSQSSSSSSARSAST